MKVVIKKKKLNEEITSADIAKFSQIIRSELASIYLDLYVKRAMWKQ